MNKKYRKGSRSKVTLQLDKSAVTRAKRLQRSMAKTAEGKVFLNGVFESAIERGLNSLEEGGA